MEERPRVRDIGLSIGQLSTGPLNAITDVTGVRVGHTTLIRGRGDLVPGVGPVRTGVTAILPHSGNLFREKVAGAVHRLNGFGEVTNADQVREMGVIDTPILLTGTLNVPRVADALLDWALARDPDMAVTTWAPSPIVAECSDAYLTDARGRHVHSEHVAAALDGAGDGPVAEGTVGGGTGMMCCEFKGGIGTSSRVIPEEHGGFTVGALVMSNFGRREHLLIDGVPVGLALKDWKPTEPAPEAKSSIIIVLATDAPLDARQLDRLCVRAGAGLARTGGLYSTSSGDFAIAFSTTNRIPHSPDGPVIPQQIVAESLIAGRTWERNITVNLLFQAVIEATEEAILNSIFKATTLDGWSGHIRHALPVERAIQVLRRHGKDVG